MPTEDAVREAMALLAQMRALLARAEALLGAGTRVDPHHNLFGAVETSPEKPPYEEILRLWNSTCAKVGMAARTRLGNLQPKVLVAWRRYPDLGAWKLAFQECARSAWWRGEGGWRGSLDSFLRPSHYHRWFDTALGAGEQGERSDGESAKIEVSPGEFQAADEMLDEILTGARAWPEGYTGLDPRQAKGNEGEFHARSEALLAWLRTDWRFDP
jgi:hypothetical protein